MSFVFQLTVVSRSTYECNSLNVERPKALRGISELIHQSVPQAFHSLCDEKKPSDQFVTTLFKRARWFDCISDLKCGIFLSISALGSTFRRADKANRLKQEDK